ncbi:MAG: BrnT family toxin [Pyrinomonadaceae bacterium]
MDPRKAEINFRKHRVRFEEAVEAFFDPNGVEFLYDTYSDDEIRFRLLAISSKLLLLVGYTVRQEEVFRIITARKATAFETRYYNESK